MWSKFSHQTIHTGDTFDYVYLESNKVCAEMFLKEIWVSCYQEYKYINEKSPAIENVTEYTMLGHLLVRVFCLQELIDLGLISSCIHQVNMLVCNHDCPNHTYL